MLKHPKTRYHNLLCCRVTVNGILFAQTCLCCVVAEPSSVSYHIMILEILCLDPGAVLIAMYDQFDFSGSRVGLRV